MLAVNVCPNTALPVMETVPLKFARSVENAADGLFGEAKCVAVSARRWMNVYDVFGVNPSNTGDDCHDVPAFRLYSQPETLVSVILVGAPLDLVGAEGAVWLAFATAAVLEDVTLPLQFAAVTTTLI